jgi:hypothetical protein
MGGGEEVDPMRRQQRRKNGVSFNTIFAVFDVTAKEDNKSII